MDAIDTKILHLLQGNSKLGTKEIAAEIGLTVTPTYERVKRLERTGVIEHYTIKVNREAVGQNLQVLCQVTLKEHNLELLNAFETQVVQLPEVASCFHIAGDYDYALIILVADMNAYEVFLREVLTTIPSIGNVQSSFVMNELK